MAEHCADLSDQRDEPLLATASRVERWLLVEHPGSWDAAAPPAARLSADVVQHLGALARQQRARLLMVRRPLRSTQPGRWVFSVSSLPGSEGIWAQHVDNDDELLALAPVGDWEPRRERLWLVCTQGRHDFCCAVRGRPVANAMLAADPENVWEASHVGGDRFAANLVLLPEGHYFGRVTAEQVPTLLADVDQDLIDLRTWRGRSSLPLPVQAAQSFARAATGRRELDAHALLDLTPDGTDQWRVRLTGEVEVSVRQVRDGTAARLTCSAEREAVAPQFELISLNASSG